MDSKAAETQSLMDLDTPADVGLVKNLITDATNKATQKLRAELGQVKKLLKDSLVKEQRGNRGSASDKKEKDRRGNKKKKDEAIKGADVSELATSEDKLKKKKKRRQRRKKKQKQN